MIEMKSKNLEYEQFLKLSNEWWDEEGQFKVLHQIKPLRMEYILKQFDKIKINKLQILDLGCGGGLICEPLARLGAGVTGVDFVENNIKIARKHAKQKKLKINYMFSDIEKIILNKKFDLIILFEILEHLEDWRGFLLNIYKNLKPGGKIIISTINRNIIAKYTAIHLAENLLKWIPKSTHDYQKFIKPSEIKYFAEIENLKFQNLTGLVFNPLEFKWRLSKNTTINYFCTLSKF